jgi:antitoxin ParD1/3/4
MAQSAFMEFQGHRMTTRNVVLSPQQSALVDGFVASGRFQNASEVLRAGLRLLEAQEAELADLRTRLATSLDQACAGLRAEGTGEEAVRRAFARARATGA